MRELASSLAAGMASEWEGQWEGPVVLLSGVCGVVWCVHRVFLWSADPLRMDEGKTLPQCCAALKDSWTHPLRPCSLSDTVVGYEYDYHLE